MGVTFRATEPAELPRIAGFLSRSLSAQFEASEPNLRHMEWKYFSPQPGWEGSRSYVLESPAGFLAHLAVWPGTLLTPDGGVPCTHFIDWAADPGELVAGTGLLRRIMRMVDRTFCIGGSEDTRKILPIVGFRPANEARMYALPVHPLQQIRTHQNRNWKLPARLVRNTLLSMRRMRAPSGWTAEVTAPRAAETTVWQAGDGPAWGRHRSAELYEYYVASPVVKFRFLELREHGRAVGGCCAAWASGQVRICDFWVADPTAERLGNGLAAALERVGVLGNPAEASIRVSTSAKEKAAVTCGFRKVRSYPIMVFPGVATSGAEFDCGMLVDDASFLATHRPWYWT